MTVAQNTSPSLASVDGSKDESSPPRETVPEGSTRQETTTKIIIEEKRRIRGQEGGYSTHGYRLEKYLGLGGSAKVFQCTALDTGKVYALKIIPKTNLVKKINRQNLQREVAIHSTLKHKHICKFHHYFQDKTNFYMVLELCPNGTLNDLIRVRKTLSETEAACILRDLVHAVHYMHDNLIIHGDLKPHNIFLDKHMRIKVGDFGLASKLKHPNGKCRRFCGTPNYVAPEVLARKEVRAYSIQVDIWSMGVILYCMLVGTPPFEAETVKSTYKRIQATDYHFPAHTTVSPQARDLIASMLQSKPEKRATLDEIRRHPFFNVGRNTPLYVPSSVSTVEETETRPTMATKTRSKSQDTPLERVANRHSGDAPREEQSTTSSATSTKRIMDPFELMSKDFRLCLHQEGFAR